MMECYGKEQQQSAEPTKKRVFERDFVRMATLTNEVMMLRRTLERDDLHEILLCLYGPYICEKAFESAEQLETFVAQYCPFIRVESGGGVDEKKIFHWDSAGDQPQKSGLDRMATGTAFGEANGEESD
uniref:Uncharacterized protein n=1 Tax=Globodera rostochiensis TaxID=31243 RepID=A0A914H4G7_GLORO